MKRKLTLSIDQQVIESAKAYARQQGRSLSNIIEQYLSLVSAKRSEEDHQFSPQIDALAGSLELEGDKSYKEIVGDAILDKYLN